MQSLTVLYDARCPLCSRIKRWIEVQPSYLPLVFLPAASAEARRRFPHLDHEATTAELTVVSDEGDVYREERAWLICLWALHDYREWALRLSAPQMLPLARGVVVWVAEHRFRFGGSSLDAVLADVGDTPGCAEGSCAR